MTTYFISWRSRNSVSFWMGMAKAPSLRTRSYIVPTALAISMLHGSQVFQAVVIADFAGFAVRIWLTMRAKRVYGRILVQFEEGQCHAKAILPCAAGSVTHFLGTIRDRRAVHDFR